MFRRFASTTHASLSFATIVLATTCALTASVLVASSAQADEHEAADPAIKYRQSVMSIIGTNMGAIGDIMKHQLQIPGGIAIHAGEMADSAALIAPAFKKNVSAGPTDAKAEIWNDWAKFEKEIAEFEKAARKLETTAKGGDPKATGAAVKALGKSCGGCHKPFRKPKEESFRNK